MKIFLAGGAGYIGSVLAELLLEQGHDVKVYDRFFFGDRLDPHPALKRFIGDTRDVIPVDMEGCDAVVDLAGLSNDATAEIDPDYTQSINVDGAGVLIGAAERVGIRRYVYISSASVYGHADAVPCDEARVPEPLTAYAESKVEVEDILLHGRVAIPEPVVLRLATVFGLSPRMRFDLAVNVMTMRAWRDGLIYVMGGGDQWRPFVHVLDACRAIALALTEEGSKVAGQVFNVGGDKLNMQLSALALEVARRFPNAKVHWIPDQPDKRSYRLDFSKIRGTLGFEPTAPVYEGIGEIASALERGMVDADEPTAYTLQWYKSLLEWDRRLANLKLNGRLL